MKKVLLLVAAIAIAFGIGLGVNKVTNQAGDPPVGAPVYTALVHTFGDPPVG